MVTGPLPYCLKTCEVSGEREFQLGTQLSLSFTVNFYLKPRLCITVYQTQDNNCQQFQGHVYIMMFDFH